MKRRIYSTKVSIDTLVLVGPPGGFEDKDSAGSGKTGARITRKPAPKDPGHSPERILALEDAPERNEMLNEIRRVVESNLGSELGAFISKGLWHARN